MVADQSVFKLCFPNSISARRGRNRIRPDIGVSSKRSFKGFILKSKINKIN